MNILSKKDIIDSQLFSYKQYYNDTFYVELTPSEAIHLTQFKVVKETILKYQTLFYNKKSFSIEASRNSLVCYSANYLKKSYRLIMGSLLEGLILNKEALDMFADEKLVLEIKPLIQEALKDETYNRQLHEILMDSLYSTKATQFLLDCGLDANYQNQDGLTPLMVAKNTGVVKALLSAGANILTKNTINAHSSQTLLNISSLQTKFESLINKNAYEMHSILEHNTILNILKQSQNKDTLTHSEYFQKEYESVKLSPSKESLIKQIKKENSVIFDNLDEFKDLLKQQHHDIILMTSTINKAKWLEKIIDLVGVDTIIHPYFSNNIFLEAALNNNSYDSAKILLEKKIYELDSTFDELLNKVFNEEILNLINQVAPEKINFQHLLNSSSIELLTEFLNQGKTCDGKTFNLFCQGLKYFMTYKDYKMDFDASNLKLSVIDSLSLIIKMEKNQDIKNQHFNTLLESALVAHDPFYSIYNNLKEDKLMKSKAQKLIKNFPDKMSFIIQSIHPKFNDLKVELEKKNLQKSIQMPKIKKELQEKDEIKIKRHKI